jgi:hypothetical protein
MIKQKGIHKLDDNEVIHDLVVGLSGLKYEKIVLV